MCARAKKEKERERGAFFGAFFCVVPFFGQRFGTEKKSACRMRNYIISFSRAKPFDDDDDDDGDR